MEFTQKEKDFYQEKTKNIFANAEIEKDKIKAITSECLKWTFPNNGDLNKVVSRRPNKKNETVDQYDDTSIIAATALANYISQNITPAGQTWARLKIYIPPEDQEGMAPNQKKAIDIASDKITNAIFRDINKANSINALYQSYENFVGAGTGAIKLIKMPPFSKNAVVVKNLPLSNLFFTEDTYERPENVFYSHIEEPPQLLYDLFGEKNVTLDKELQQLKDNDNKQEFDKDRRNYIEGCIILEHGKTHNEYLHFMADEEFQHFYFAKKLKYNPFIVFRWSKNNNSHIWGNALISKTLSNVKTLNQLVKIELEKAQAMADPAYMGIMDPAYRSYAGTASFTKQMKFEPGKITPLEGVASVQPVVPAYDLRPANISADQIRRTLFDLFNSKPLGNVDETKYRTAEEMALRHQEFLNQFAPTYGRMQLEFLEPFIMTYYQILKELNQLGLTAEEKELIQQLKIEYLNPLSKVEAQEMVQNIINYKMLISQIVDPEINQVMFDDVRVATLIAEKMSVPADIINDAQAIKDQLQKRQAMQREIMEYQMGMGQQQPQGQEAAPAQGMGG